jgi:hypothetical protein
VKHLIDIEKTGIVEFAQDFGIGFKPDFTVACLDDGAPEAAPYVAEVA